MAGFLEMYLFVALGTDQGARAGHFAGVIERRLFRPFCQFCQFQLGLIGNAGEHLEQTVFHLLYIEAPPG
jgi:hypothetical protein